MSESLGKKFEQFRSLEEALTIDNKPGKEEKDIASTSSKKTKKPSPLSLEKAKERDKKIEKDPLKIEGLSSTIQEDIKELKRTKGGGWTGRIDKKIRTKTIEGSNITLGIGALVKVLKIEGDTATIRVEPQAGIHYEAKIPKSIIGPKS